MSRSANERFDDILSAIQRCRTYRNFLGSNDNQLSEVDNYLDQLAKALEDSSM
jgi:hypothetical protein